MSKPLYLYIDDEKDESIDAIIDGFKDVGQIDVALLDIGADKKFEDVKTALEASEYDGLILDLKLDGEGPNRLNFRAPTLAQDIRTLTSSDHSRKATPLILCSTEARMRYTYDTDKTSHDLFDYKFLKGSEPDWIKFSNKLFSLANGYKWLGVSQRNVSEVLGDKDVSKMDSRIIEKFVDTIVQPNDYSYFVIKELFNHPGPLVKESVVAARLGIDIAASGESWKVLLERFNSALFKGLFSDGWTRWWADDILKTFKEISGGKRLATLDAVQRINILSEQTGIQKLVAAKPILHCISSNFWTICEGSKRPLDPLEGFRVFETSSINSWQENKYMSFEAIMSREYEGKGLRPHPSEKDRIQSLKETLSKK